MKGDDVVSAFLPIGTVVLLKESTKRVMIYGRLQKEIDGDRVWDYIGCLYPEGNINPDHSYLFDTTQIESIFFIGCQDEEEMRFQQYLQDTIKQVK
jgi:hypothetical protein